MRPSISIALLLLCVACRAESATRSVPPAPSVTAGLDSAVTLAPGTSALVAPAGMLLTFDRVTSESRCPNNALIQCVWGGFASVSVRVSGGTATRTVTLTTLQASDTITVDRYLLRLVELAPYPLTLDSIPGSRYRATLRLTAK